MYRLTKLKHVYPYPSSSSCSPLITPLLLRTVPLRTVPLILRPSAPSSPHSGSWYRYVTTASGKTHYQVLGVKPTASPEEIKQAFTRLVKELHPDTNPSLTSENNNYGSRNSTYISSVGTQKFMELKEAFDILRDQTKRTTYDQQLAYHRSLGYDPDTLHKRAAHFRKHYQQTNTNNSNSDWFYNTNASPSNSRLTPQHHLINIIELLIRPRMFFISPLIALLSWYLMSLTHDKDYYPIDSDDKIKAWFNPTTQRWETPAPWDPLYRQNSKNTKMVHRKEVYVSVPPYR